MKDRPLALTPGAQLGRFTVVRLLAAGGMGEVYEAKDSQRWCVWETCVKDEAYLSGIPRTSLWN